MSDTTPEQPQAEIAAPFSASPPGVGATLRAARARTGKSLAEVATLLRIRQPYLLALEEGRHKDLPGGAYAIGFLRTYAEFLTLDGEEMVRRFRAEASGELNPRSELVFPSPVSEGRVPGGAVLFVGLLVAGLAYGAWYWLSSRETSVAEMVPTLPERLSSVLNRPATVTSPPAPVEAAKPAEPEAAKTEEPAPAAPAKENEVVPPAEDDEAKPAKVEEPAKPQTAAAPPPAAPAPVAPPVPAPAPAPAAQPQAPQAQPAPAPQPAAVKSEPPKPAEAAKPVEAAKPAEPAKPAADIGDSRVVLTAAGDDCWIQVREMDGQLLMSKLLRKGDSYAVPNRPGLTLMVGNAGALDVSVDGKKAASLGAPGQVRRDISLDPAKLGG